MELTFNRKVLEESLKRLSHTVSKAGILPVIGNVLIRVIDDSTALLVTTDLSATGKSYAPYVRTDTWGEITLPFVELYKFVSMQRGDEIKMTQKENGDIVATCGRPRVTLKTLPAGHFPALPSFDEIAFTSFNAVDILTGLTAIVGITEPQSHVTMQTGVWMESSNRKLSLFGMSNAVVGGIDFATDSDTPFSLMVRTDTLQKMMAALPGESALEFGSDSERVYVKCGSYQFVGQRVNLDKFVDWRGFYKEIFAREAACEIHLDSGLGIANIMKQFESLFPISGPAPVWCSAKDGVLDFTKRMEGEPINHFETQLEAEIIGEMNVPFDIRLAKVIFSNITGPVTIRFFDKMQPLQITSENKEYVFVLFRLEE